jgi:hypothetical protein
VVQGGPGPFQAIGAGYGFSCVLKLDGTVYCFGFNQQKNLDGTSQTPTATGVKVAQVTNAVGLVVGPGTSCAWTAGGDGWCWGDNDDGELGNGDAPNDGIYHFGRNDIAGFAIGQYSTCFWTKTGSGYCFGDNDYLQLGNDASSSSDTPMPVPAVVGNIVKIVLGLNHACSLNNEGVVYCWGKNDDGELGLGFFSEPLVPTIPALYAAKDIAAHEDHTCAITLDDEMLCWGSDSAVFTLAAELTTVNKRDFSYDCPQGKGKAKAKAKAPVKTDLAKKGKIAGLTFSAVAVTAIGGGMILRRLRKRNYTPLGQTAPVTAVTA